MDEEQVYTTKQRVLRRMDKEETEGKGRDGEEGGYKSIKQIEREKLEESLRQKKEEEEKKEGSKLQNKMNEDKEKEKQALKNDLEQARAELMAQHKERREARIARREQMEREKYYRSRRK